MAIVAQDTFDSRVGAIWTTAVGASIVAGRCRLAARTDFSSALLTDRVYSLRDTVWTLEVPAVPLSTPGNPGAWMDAIVSRNGEGDTLNGWTFYVNDGSLVLRETVGAVNSDVALTYDPAAHRWWRLRFVGTAVSWETSADGAAWIARRSKIAGSSLAARASAELGTGYGGTAPSPLYLELDNFSIADGPVASTPDGVMVGVGDGRAVVFWDQLDTAPDGYRVYRDGVEVYDGQGLGDRGTVAFEDTGLTNGTSYSYTVAAYDGDGVESAESTAIVVRPLASTPQAGGSRSFGGSDLVRLLPGIEPQEQPNATFVLVVKPNSVASAMGLLRADASASQGDSSDPFVLRMSSSGELILDVYNPVSTSISASGIRLTAGVWQMIAVTFTTPNRAPPRFHCKNMATGVITHSNGSPDHTYTIHPHGTWTVGDRFSGLIALAAVIEQSDDSGFAALDLDAIAALAYAQWDERDEFLQDRSGGTAYALRNAITGTTHSTDSPPSLWPSVSNRLAMVV